MKATAMTGTEHPEAKLLQLLRKKEKHGKSERIYNFLRSVRSLFHGLTLRIIEQPVISASYFFLLLTILTIAYGVTGIIRYKSTSRKLISREIEETPGKITTERNHSIDYYSSVINGRNLFRTIKVEPPPPPKVISTPTPPPVMEPPKPTLLELASYLQLVGVINTGQAQAVILNKRDQKTLYLSVGDTIGEMKVIKIQENKVTLKLNDETIDLSL